MLSLLLFGLVFCLFSIFLSSRKRAINWANFLDGSSYHLACLLEDAPSTALKGQFYPLATPLMTPFACVVPQTWHQFYSDNLGKSGVNYWEWRDKPESRNICRELSWLLDLPVPNSQAKKILEGLAEGKNPFENFYRENLTGKSIFLEQYFQDKKRIYVGFKQWHEQAKDQIGIEGLKSVYQVCYGTDWDLIEEIFAEKSFLIFSQYLIDKYAPWWKVLGVTPQSNHLQVEQAYKSLVRVWHPDLNQHPFATDVTARINIAYDHYQAFYEKSQPIPQNNYNNSKLWVKIREWIRANRIK
ncbi:heat shock protein DnaJ domain protein [Gloeothece citriformis PCC 7424]|uniref:Heat shock protein DnaJ domain protein n=1 Tax=Gloeothece citriformis (strain PCC 7424) TaxID=65393 RepID=B7KHG2_GLOC7|nr:J domain-containing protein [Gloeothece citriformis]ACK70657.1 heat shock protein DnaJ domain protein [Gloeothece citriformis PCC 7424]